MPKKWVVNASQYITVVAKHNKNLNLTRIGNKFDTN